MSETSDALPEQRRTVYAVVPGGVDDPSTPSGGNIYDRRVLAGLAGQGWTVRELPVGGAWPLPDPSDRTALAGALAALPDHAVVLLDGLIASAAAEVLPAESDRLRQVVLVHLPLAETDADAGAIAGERTVLSGAQAVLATSEWTRQRLIQRFDLPAASVHVAVPGVDPVPTERTGPTGARSGQGGDLLCVAAVTRQKGHDVLVAGLTAVAELAWECRCLGSLSREPGFAEQVRAATATAGLADRVLLTGPLVGSALERAYATTDLLVHPSRGETYGMVLAEAIAHGVPVLATDVGGVREAIQDSPDDPLPALLVPPGDPDALGAALRRWLTEPSLRAELRAAAVLRRATLPSWTATVQQVHRVLLAVAA